MLGILSVFVLKLFRVMVQKIYRLGTHLYQVGHGSHSVVISGTRVGTFTVHGGLMQ